VPKLPLKLLVQGGDLRRPRGVGRCHLRGAEVGALARAGATARCAAAGHLDPPGTGADAGTGGTTEQVSCHPFPRPVRHRALLRGRERRRGTTGPRLLPQRSARRAEGSWSGREEPAREAPTLSCRTRRGTSKRSPPQADLDDGAAGATRSVARRALLARPTDRGATTSAARPPVIGPCSPDKSRRPLPNRSPPPPAVPPCSGCGVTRHESSVARSGPARSRPSGCCGGRGVVHRDPLRRSGPDAREADASAADLQ
jgi:hypothetical protein